MTHASDPEVPGRAAPSQLRVSTSGQGRCSIVTAAGPVDLSNTHRLHYALTSALHPDRALIADLSAVTFMDSRGLLTLMLMQRNADLQHARLIIVPSEQIAALIRLAAGDLLNVSPSLATALIDATGDAPAPQVSPLAAAPGPAAEPDA